MLWLQITNSIRIYNKQPLKYSVQCLNKTSRFNYASVKPQFRNFKDNQRIGPFGWFLLVIPASTFALGTWQIQRKKWKENLIAELRDQTNADPVKLPEDLRELENMEYKPVHVRGTFLHDKELYMGPRTLIVKGDSATTSQLMSSSKQNQGYWVITPFKLADREETILVNRGWIPAKCRNPSTRKNGQVQGEVDVIGIVRLHENRPNFSPKNQAEANQWYYKDLHQMAQITNAVPVLLDATTDFNVPEGPVGGQTRITLRNEHLSYVFTWYSLCGATSYLWYKQFLQKIK